MASWSNSVVGSTLTFYQVCGSASITLTNSSALRIAFGMGRLLSGSGGRHQHSLRGKMT
jgi:hypothetical protein